MKCMKVLFIAIIVAIMLGGCGPYGAAQVNKVKVGSWNTEGVKTIAVMPFVFSENEYLTEDIFTSAARRYLNESKVFTLVDNPEQADAVLLASITKFGYSAMPQGSLAQHVLACTINYVLVKANDEGIIGENTAQWVSPVMSVGVDTEWAYDVIKKGLSDVIK